MKLLSLLPVLVIFVLVSGCASTGTRQDDRAFSDIHLHYNYRHKEIISARETVDILKQHDVVLATVSSEPSHMALEMNDVAGDWIIPFASLMLDEKITLIKIIAVSIALAVTIIVTLT